MRDVLDHDTKKISAFQLAEVLAKVDGAAPGGATEGSRPNDPRSEAPKRTVSGTRPVVRPPVVRPNDAVASSPSADGIDIPEGGLAAAVERTVAETQVVNATTDPSPIVEPVVGAVAIPDGRLGAVIERPVSETQVVNATSPLAPGSSSELAGAPSANASPAVSIVGSAGRRRTAVLVVAVVLAIAAALALAYVR